MKKRTVLLLIVLVFAVAIVILDRCSGGNRQPPGDDPGFNPPDRSVEEPLSTVTVFPLLTEPAFQAPVFTTPSPATSQVSNSMVISGQLLVNNRCTVCHSISTIMNAEKSPEEWAATVEQMVLKGAVLDETEKQSVISYLSQAFPARELDNSNMP